MFRRLSLFLKALLCLVFHHRYYAPVTFLSGPQSSLKYLVEKLVVLDSYNDYENLLLRSVIGIHWEEKC